MEHITNEEFCYFIERNKPFLSSLHEECKEEEVEKGLLICKREGEIFFGGVCTGRDCAVEIEDCGEGEPIGRFHSHLRETVTPSKGDLISGLYRKNLKRECISGVSPILRDPSLFCYEYKETPEGKAFWEDLKRHKLEGEEWTMEEKREFIKKMIRVSPSEASDVICWFDIEDDSA